MLFSRSVIVSALMGFAAAQSGIASAQSSLSTGSAAAGGNTPEGMAPTHVIQVGGPNGSLVFSPSNVQAKAGELIQFQFRAKVREYGTSSSSQLTTHAEPLRCPVNLRSTLYPDPEHDGQQDRRLLLWLHAHQCFIHGYLERPDLHHPCQGRKAHVVLLLAGKALPGRYGWCSQRVRYFFTPRFVRHTDRSLVPHQATRPCQPLSPSPLKQLRT
jgi:hypothetical protein